MEENLFSDSLPGLVRPRGWLTDWRNSLGVTQIGNRFAILKVAGEGGEKLAKLIPHVVERLK